MGVKYQYQWEHFVDHPEAKKDIAEWESDFGPIVIKRTRGKAEDVRFKVLIDNPTTKVYLIGNFNDWGKKDLEDFELKHDANSIFAKITTDKLKHNDPYKFLLIQEAGKDRPSLKMPIQDPASSYFDNDGNSVFWDFKDPSCYKQKHKLIDTVNRPTKVLQTDLPGLIVHWADKNGKLGQNIPQKDYFKFITESGVIEHIKELGFNTIQFLPFAQSIDGDNWKFRYLVPFQFAIQKNWGNPDDFARMIDAFHREGIAVMGDFIISHLPYKDFNIFGKSCDFGGVHQWLSRHGYELYMKEPTPWGTMRIDYDNRYVCEFIISSCLHFMKHYRIDGYRIDNVDGIIRFGDSGEGDERPNGRNFLRSLNKTLYAFNPFALIHFESHYFYKDNAKMLVVPFEEDKRALGATAYNSSRTTYYFHVEYMLKSAEKISPWKFKDIVSEKEWGQSNSTIADFHNHDAAAGLMELRATGSYAYDAMTAKQPHNHFHALGKIKVMEAIITFCAEGRTLDLMQTFLLQKGTFEHDSSIRWQLTFNQCNHNLVEYKKALNKIMDDPAFWPLNTKNRKFLNVDEKNKIIVVERSSERSNYVIVINLSSWMHHNYKVGVVGRDDYELVLNADLFDYSGTGMSSYPKVLKNNPSNNFEFLDRELHLDSIAPYGVIVLKRKD